MTPILMSVRQFTFASNTPSGPSNAHMLRHVFMLQTITINYFYLVAGILFFLAGLVRLLRPHLPRS